MNWDSEIIVEHAALTEHPIIVAYDPASVLLSTGPCEPATVIHALRRLGGIARWPNQNDIVTLLLTTCNIPGQTEPVGNPRILAGSCVAEPPTGWST